MLAPVPIAHQVASLYQLQIRPGLLESEHLTESGANCAVCDIVTPPPLINYLPMSQPVSVGSPHTWPQYNCEKYHLHSQFRGKSGLEFREFARRALI